MKKINLKKPTRNQVIRICNLLSVPLQFLGCCVLYLVIEAAFPSFAAGSLAVYDRKPSDLFIQCIFNFYHKPCGISV